MEQSKERVQKTSNEEEGLPVFLIILAPFIIFLVGLIATCAFLPGPSLPDTTSEAEISIDEYPYAIEVYEGGRYTGGFLVKDYETMSGGITFKNYYANSLTPGGGYTVGYVHHEREVIFTGCKFVITEREKPSQDYYAWP